MKNGINSENKNHAEIVAVKRCSNYESRELSGSIKACLELTGGFPGALSKTRKILLKPNLLSPTKPELCVTTNPAFIESIIWILKSMAPAGSEIIIADSPGVSTPHTEWDLKKLYDVCGITPLGDIDGVTLNFDTGFSVVSFKEGKTIKQLEVINPVVEADFIINLPKFKTHSLTRITGAVKNMFGMIHGRTKTLLHTKFMDSDKFANMLLDVYLYKKPSLSIMDAVVGLEGVGPGPSGKPRFVGLIIASKNAIALDVVMAEIMGFKIEDIPLIRCAAERGLPGSGKSEIIVAGANMPELVIKDYKLPKISPVDKISKNRFVNTYMLPFIRNTLSLSPHQDIEKCKMCDVCVEICPEKAIKNNGKKLDFDYKKCIRCYCCSEMCPYGAIDLRYSLIGNLIFGKKNIK